MNVDDEVIKTWVTFNIFDSSKAFNILGKE